MRRLLVSAVAVCLLLTSTYAGAAVEAGIKCQQLKMKARASLARCLAKKASDVIAGSPDASAACRDKFRARIGKVDAKATKAGTSCRFLDNGDGTVSDLDTGLTWERKAPSNESDPFGYPSGYHTLVSWSFGPPDENGPYSTRDGAASKFSLTQLNGANAAEGTSAATCRGGHCDWRMPTLGELKGLIDTRYFEPAVDPGLVGTQPNFHLSATVFAGNPSLAWRLQMRDGSLLLTRKVHFSTMRAVRAAF